MAWTTRNVKLNKSLARNTHKAQLYVVMPRVQIVYLLNNQINLQVQTGLCYDDSQTCIAWWFTTDSLMMSTAPWGLPDDSLVTPRWFPDDSLKTARWTLFEPLVKLWQWYLCMCVMCIWCRHDACELTCWIHGDHLVTIDDAWLNPSWLFDDDDLLIPWWCGDGWFLDDVLNNIIVGDLTTSTCSICNGASTNKQPVHMENIHACLKSLLLWRHWLWWCEAKHLMTSLDACAPIHHAMGAARM